MALTSRLSRRWWICLVVLAALVGAPGAGSRVAPLNSCQSAGGRPISELRRSPAPFGNSRGLITELPGNPFVTVAARCTSGPTGGWSIVAVAGIRRYHSARFGFTDPIAILALYNYAPGKRLPAIVAQVGYGMTGQPYELLTFKGRKIVPAKMTFTKSWPGSALEGGGATEHGQGLFCSSHNDQLLITEAVWSGPGPGAPTVTTTTRFGKGTKPAPIDPVTVRYARWTLKGQPLHEVRFSTPPANRVIYAAATRLENAHC